MRIDPTETVLDVNDNMPLRKGKKDHVDVEGMEEGVLKCIKEAADYISLGTQTYYVYPIHTPFSLSLSHTPLFPAFLLYNNSRHSEFSCWYGHKGFEILLDKEKCIKYYKI